MGEEKKSLQSAATRQEVLKRLQAKMPEFRERYGVSSLYLFGSAAREELTPGSDVDVAVSFEGPGDARGYDRGPGHRRRRLCGRLQHQLIPHRRLHLVKGNPEILGEELQRFARDKARAKNLRPDPVHIGLPEDKLGT